MEALAGNHTEALHGHEGGIALLEEDSSRTHFILGDVDRRLIELERDIPPQEGDSGVTLREGTRPFATNSSGLHSEVVATSDICF